MAILEHRLKPSDVSQIAIGSLVLAFPVSVTEEVWNLSEELSMLRVLSLLAGSIIVIGLFVYVMYSHESTTPSRKDFFTRVGAVYFVTFLICALLLGAIDRLNILVDPAVALKRTILVAFPACFSATVIDSLH